MPNCFQETWRADSESSDIHKKMKAWSQSSLLLLPKHNERNLHSFFLFKAIIWLRYVMIADSDISFKRLECHLAEAMGDMNRCDLVAYKVLQLFDEFIPWTRATVIVYNQRTLWLPLAKQFLNFNVPKHFHVVSYHFHISPFLSNENRMPSCTSRCKHRLFLNFPLDFLSLFASRDCLLAAMCMEN